MSVETPINPAPPDSELGPSETPIDRVLRGGNHSALQPKPGYYDVSLLKAPVWTPEVGAYFFLGGLSAGAFVLSRVAERVGGLRFADVRRIGAYVALAAALPCAPLLIVDLGDRKRFHHMLRVFKPQSPMNVGSWALTVYSGLAAMSALRERQFGARRFAANMTRAEVLTDGAIGAVVDVVGLPAALILAGYTGVLLSTTSTPIWCKNSWLGPLFSASAMSTGCAAVRAVLEVGDLAKAERNLGRQKSALNTFSTAAHTAEAAALVGFVAAAGKLAAPIVTGPQSREFLGGSVALGLLIPEAIERLPLPRRAKPWATLVGLAAALIGGLALRHSIIEAGKTSGRDPDAARESSSQR